MKSSLDSKGKLEARIDRNLILMGLIWTFLLGLIFAWDCRETRNAALTITRTGAQEALIKDTVYRLWATSHGGVYVPETATSPPNPYLSHIPERDITTPSGKKLTLINPAYMTRQVHKLGGERYGIEGHITSLNLIRPENAPDEWERNALLQFEQEKREVSSIETIDETPYLRLMRPLIVEDGCLKCHAQQGYKVGDIRGGISVSVPWQPIHAALMRQVFGAMWGFAGMWFLGLVGLYAARKSLQNALAERREMEQRLVESEDRYRSLCGNMSDAVALYRAEKNGDDFVFVDFNRAAELIERISRHEIIGRSVLEVFPQVREFGIFDAFQRVWRTGKAERFMLKLYQDERIQGWRDNFIYKLPSGEIVAVYSDETQRMQAEIALRESEERWQYALEGADEGVWDFNTETNRMYFSKRWKAIFGYGEDEIRDSPDEYNKRIHPDDKPKRDQDLERHFRGETAEYRNEHRVLCKDSSYKWVLSRGKVVQRSADGAPIRVVGTSSDITDRKRAEEEHLKMEARLRNAHKMEAIGTLAGGIAHDFNNILGVIVGYTELATDGVPPESRTRADLEQVLNASFRARDLVRQILAFSRQGETEERLPIKIGPIVTEAMKFLRAVLPTSIEFHLSIEEGLHTVLANPAQINQVVLNLCTNAGHAMRENGGTLDIGLEEIELDEETAQRHGLGPGLHLRLWIRDTGHGMNKTTLDRLFDPYFTTKDVGEGSGLGLAVVQGIVRRHGGAIAVASEPGAGSLFEVFLPIMEQASETRADRIGEEILPRGSERVLVVDDELPLARLTERMLQQLGYQVTATANSREALDRFRVEPEAFDIIVTDYTMPGMTGVDLARKTMAIRPGIPVVLCSGYSAIISEKEARANGIREFCMKPLTLQRLAHAVRAALDRDPSETPA